MKHARKFVLFSHGRAGTTFLMNNLSAHPQVRNCMEPFHNTPANRAKAGGGTWQTGSSSKAFAYGRIFRPHAASAAAVGFKLFYFHCRQDPVSADLWDALLQDTSVHLIFLNRRNLLNKHLSDLRAQASGVWHPNDAAYLSTDYKQVTELSVDTRKLMPVMSNLYCGYHITRERFRHHPSRHYFFEDLEQNSTEILQEVYGFLGLEPRSIASPFRSGTLSRQTTRILNEAEVRDQMTASIFSEYIETCPLLQEPARVRH